MLKKTIISLMAVAILFTACGNQTETNILTTEEGVEYLPGNVLATDLIQVTIPDEFQGKTYGIVGEDSITIYDRALVDDGFPGMVFSVGTSADNDKYGGGMYSKVGELVNGDGTIYNVSVGYASEVQWDYNDPEMPESYGKLLDAVDGIIENISGVGDNKFNYKAGTKGEELYGEVIDKYTKAIDEIWEPAKFEEAGMSPELGVLISDAQDPFGAVGYAYMDINGDGIDELFIGDKSGGELDGAVYDIYTMVNREPKLVVSGTARDRYYAYNGFAICNEYSGGAGENGDIIYIIEPNSTETLWQFAYKYDEYTNEKQPWFLAYSDEEWTPLTEDEYNDAMERIANEKMQLEFKTFK